MRITSSKYLREETQRICAWNNLVREIKLIAFRHEQILKRLDAYGEKLHNVEQEACIAANAANAGVAEIEVANKARRVLEGNILKTSDFMDRKIDYVHERIDKIEEIESHNVEREISIE